MKLLDYLDAELKPMLVGESPLKDSIYDTYPVVDFNHQIVGIVSHDNPNEIAELNEDFILAPQNHILESLQKMKASESNAVFVVENGRYLGAITPASIMHFLQDSLAIDVDFSILELKVKREDYSLSDLSKTIESENCQIIHLYTQYENHQQDIFLTLTLSRNDLKSILGILENKGYQIIHFFNEKGVQDVLKERYENLMYYLDL